MRSATIAAAALSLFFATAVYGGSCDAADQLLTGTHYDEAQKLYLVILKRDKNEQCARTGLEKIAGIRAEGARHLELATLYESVADKGAATRESLEAARLGITRQARPAAPQTNVQEDVLAEARWLAAAGLHEVALEKLKKAADTAPPKDELPKELRYLTGPRLYHLVTRHKEETFVSLIATALLMLFVLRRKLHPRLKIGNLDDPSGVAVGRGAALYLQQQLLSLTRSQGSGGISFVTTPLTQVTVPAAISTAIPTTLDWIKPVLGLLSAVDWRRSLTLTGCAQPAIDRRGVGLTLVLTRDNAIVSTVTLWQSAFGKLAVSAAPTTVPAVPPDATVVQPPATADLSPYFDLAEPAAIWLLFQLLQATGTEPNEVRRIMGTTQWMSYAFNAAAVRAEQISTQRSQEMLIKALALDPDNGAARANLGLLLQESAGLDEQQLQRALDQLQVARTKQPSDDADPVFFTASYYIAYVHYSLYVLTNERKHLQSCSDELRNLVRIMKERKNKAVSDRIRNYIAGTLSTVDVFRIGVDAELGAIAPSAANHELRDYRDHPAEETQYNLACTYSVLARLTKGNAEQHFFLIDSMSHLKFALHLNPARYEEAGEDPSLAMVKSRRAAEFNALMAEAKKAATPVPQPAQSAAKVAAPDIKAAAVALSSVPAGSGTPSLVTATPAAIT